VNPTALVLILALLLVFGGWAAILIGRMLRDQTDARETAGNVLLLAIAFAAASVLAVELALPELEKLLRLL
jgi:hypothetical protein